MDIKLLDQKHPTYQADLWAQYDAIYRGGPAFRGLVSAFLPQNPQEPHEVYESRKREAHFTGYVGPIVDWFSAKLCSGALVVRARVTGDDDAPPSSKPGRATTDEIDPWYAQWKEDVDGIGTDLIDFVRERFGSACVKGRAWWLVEKPSIEEDAPANRAQWEALGLGGCTICPLENEQILDFETDERGALVWAVVHSCATRRATIADTRSRIVETWEVYDRETVERFEASYDPERGEQRPQQAVSQGKRPHGFSRVPLVRVGFVGTKGVKVRIGQRMQTISSAALEGFWLLNRLADPQIAHFRNAAALDWNIKRTCYAMPVFKVSEREKPPVMGAGYYIMIGKDEEATWIGPPTEHLSVLSERVDRLQQEIYRVANQLAQGVDNNAAAIGRSGLSKLADASATEVVLRVYGSLVREAIEQTYDLLADGRGDKLTWSIEGFESFSVVDASGIVEAATAAKNLNLKSKTARREIELRVVDAMLPSADQVTKDAIREETEEAYDLEDEDDEQPPTVPPGQQPLVQTQQPVNGAPPAAPQQTRLTATA